MSLTIQQTLEEPNIRSVFKNDNATIGFSVVKTLVIRFMDSFGFATKTSDSQIEIITVDTLENFAYDSLEDIIIFFKMCRQGKFGATKKGIDSNLIFGEWLPMYFDLKSDARERYHQKFKEQEGRTVLSNEQIQKAYEKLTSKKTQEEKDQKAKAHIDSLTEKMDRTMLEDTILDWSKKEEMKPYLDYLKRKRLIIK